MSEKLTPSAAPFHVAIAAERRRLYGEIARLTAKPTGAEIDAAIMAEEKRLNVIPEMCDFVEYDWQGMRMHFVEVQT